LRANFDDAAVRKEIIVCVWGKWTTSKKCKMSEWVRTGLIELEIDSFTPLDSYQITWIGFHCKWVPYCDRQKGPYRQEVSNTVSLKVYGLFEKVFNMIETVPG